MYRKLERDAVRFVCYVGIWRSLSQRWAQLLSNSWELMLTSTHVTTHGQWVWADQAHDGAHESEYEQAMQILVLTRVSMRSPTEDWCSQEWVMSRKTQHAWVSKSMSKTQKIRIFKVGASFLRSKFVLAYVYVMLIWHEYEQNVSMSKPYTQMSMSEYEFQILWRSSWVWVWGSLF